jgi:hypothetical protein
MRLTISELGSRSIDPIPVSETLQNQQRKEYLMSIGKYVVTLLLALAVSVSMLSAHDAAEHKGAPTQGQIASVVADSFQLKTATGTVKVSFNKETKFEHGDEVVDKSHLTKGAKVSVFGTKLPSGEIVAKEVVMGATPAAKAAEHAH